MYTVETSRHFTKRFDPVSGAVYYVLSTRVAPLQQGFYFVNSGFSDDGRYMWFYCAFPPTSQRALGVVDFLTDDVRWFPDTFTVDSYMVDLETGNAWWGTKSGFYMRTPHPDDSPRRIAPLPKEAKGFFTLASTHLSFSPDRKELFVDVVSGDRSVLGTINIADGSFTEWYHTEIGTIYNHALFNPVDPNLALCAHEYHSSPFGGPFEAPPRSEKGEYPRLHTISRDGVNTMYPPMIDYASHEYWNADGEKIYYVDGHRIFSTNIKTGEKKIAVDCDRFHDLDALPVTAWHSHATADEKYFVADSSFYDHGLTWWRGCPSKVTFYNTVTDKALDIVTRNPALPQWTPEDPCPYHIDPHPRFVLHDQYVSFTVTTDGRVDAAVAPVEGLLEATK